MCRKGHCKNGMTNLKSVFEDILLLLLGWFTILAGPKAHSLVLAIMVLWMTVQELRQMRIHRSKYFTVWNFTDVAALLLTAFLLFVPPTRFGEVLIWAISHLVSVSPIVTDLGTWLLSSSYSPGPSSSCCCRSTPPLQDLRPTYQCSSRRARLLHKQTYFSYFLNSGIGDFHPSLLPLFGYFGRLCNQLLHSLASGT